MKRWHAFARWLDQREDPLPLALVRIAVGFTLALDLADAWRRDLVGVLWVPTAEGGLAWGPETFLSGPALSVVCFALALAVAAGVATRLSSALLLVSYAQLGQLLPEGDRGIDVLLRAVLFIFAMSPAGATLSVDARLRTGLWAPPISCVSWPRRLLILQLVWLYFSAGTHKLQGPWTPLGGFSALYLVLQDPHFARFSIGETLRALFPLTQFATFTTMAFEWLAPGVLIAYWAESEAPWPRRLAWLRRGLRRLRARRLWIGSGVLFHVGLLVTMRLGIFPIGALALYPAFFSADEIRGAFGRWRFAPDRDPRPC